MIHYAALTAAGDLAFEFTKQQRAYCLKVFGAGACLDVEIREHRDKRSDRQNKALWALLSEWCRQSEQGWRPDELKDAMLGIVFGTVERVQPITGAIVKVNAEPHSSTLNVTKFTALIEAVLEYAAEDGVFLTAPDEFRKAKEREAQKAAAKKAKAA